MQKIITIDNIDYTLFFTKNNISPEYFIIDSLTYNSGLDYFLGSDISTAYVYLVKKENVSVFVENINNFITQCESFNIEKDENLDYLESLNDITYLHKVVDNSPYDFFISDFDMCMCREQSYIHLKEYEKFVEKLEQIATFCLYAGANLNDDNVFDFAIACLMKKYKKELKLIYTQHSYGFYIEEMPRFDAFGIINHTENKDIYTTFIQIYLSNIPNARDGKDDFDKEIEKLIYQA